MYLIFPLSILAASLFYIIVKLKTAYALLRVALHVGHHFLLVRLQQLHFDTDHLRVDDERGE